MKVSFKRHYKHLFTGAGLLLLLALTLAACTGGGGGSGGTTPVTGGSTATRSAGAGSPTTGGAIPTASLTPGVSLGPQSCPDAVKAPSHWDPIIGTQSSTSKVEGVGCANLLGNPTLQALITVRYDGSGAILDVYVYNNITSASPTQLFKLQGLYKGDARISLYNTLITAEVDQGSSINNGQPNASLQQDLFREFKWSDGAQTLVPVAFPGFFPDLTRYQAEADQAQVNQGHQPWKLDAGMTANALAVNLLKWPTSATTTVVSGGGTNDLNAVVTVKSPNPGSGTITVTLNRLERNTNGGIWEATEVSAADMSITAPPAGDRLTSPATVSGTGNAFEGKIGKVVVLDHLYNDIGHADAVGAIGNGNTTFSVSVPYTASFHGGSQEGIVALYAYSNADSSIAAAVMVKELLSA